MYVTKYIYSSTVCSIVEEIQTNILSADMCEEWRLRIGLIVFVTVVRSHTCVFQFKAVLECN